MKLSLSVKRVITAFLLAPLISCAIAILMFITFLFLKHDQFFAVESFFNILMFYCYLLLIAYIIEIVMGIPCFLLLIHLKKLNLLYVLMCSYLISLTSLILLEIICMTIEKMWVINLWLVLISLLWPLHLITLLGAFIFWWIGLRSNSTLFLSIPLPKSKT